VYRWSLNLIYALVLVLASPWLLYRSLTTGRYREGLNQKLFGRIPPHVTEGLSESSTTIWLHGVSVGEIQLLKPLVVRLRSKFPKAEFVVSTTTRTGMELAQKILASDARLFYYPFDFSWAVERAVQRINPSLIVLGELELWPNFIAIADEKQIPIAVINARLSAKSFAGYQRFRYLTRSTFEKLSLVAAQDPTYAERFVECGVSHQRIEVTGSLKFDNVNFDRNCQQVNDLRKLVGLDHQYIVWVVGSTQDPEELVSAEAYSHLLVEYPQLRLISVPRHPERFAKVFEELKSVRPEVIKRSDLKEAVSAEQWRILLVDTVGELRWWWGLADIALVGGSFGTRGGQNMLEPAAYGTNVAFGPNTSNFKDICQLLLDDSAAVRLQSLDDILPWVRSQLENPEVGIARGTRAQALVRRHQGALDRTMERLSLLLNEQIVRTCRVRPE
jgi:3-deoxy-D-manno-octulosonic-acid transferase